MNSKNFQNKFLDLLDLQDFKHTYILDRDAFNISGYLNDCVLINPVYNNQNELLRINIKFKHLDILNISLFSFFNKNFDISHIKSIISFSEFIHNTLETQKYAFENNGFFVSFSFNKPIFKKDEKEYFVQIILDHCIFYVGENIIYKMTYFKPVNSKGLKSSSTIECYEASGYGFTEVYYNLVNVIRNKICNELDIDYFDNSTLKIYDIFKH